MRESGDVRQIAGSLLGAEREREMLDITTFLAADARRRAGRKRDN